MINSKTLDPYTGEPDVARLLAAFKRKPIDRVPNFEVLYEDKGGYYGNEAADRDKPFFV